MSDDDMDDAGDDWEADATDILDDEDWPVDDTWSIGDEAEPSDAGDTDDGLLAGEHSAGLERRRLMTWDAWDVGVAFALGGWLLDEHAHRVAEEIREALEEHGRSRGNLDESRGAAHPPPPTGFDYRVHLEPLRVGEPLDQARLYSDIIEALAHQRPLTLQAEGTSEQGGGLVLVASVVPGAEGPWIWLVAELRERGFSAARLVPVFQPDQHGGVAIFASDYASQVVDAAAWACGREARQLLDLQVVQRSED